MTSKSTNQFRQVALGLISLTIIVLGLVYNQTISQSKAEMPGITSSTPVLDIPVINNIINSIINNPSITTNVTPDTSTTPDLPDQNEITPPSEVVIPPGTTITLPDAIDQLIASLDWLNQFIVTPYIVTFAQSTLEIALPEQPNLSLPTEPTTGGDLPSVAPTSPAPAVSIPTSSPTTSEVPSNEVLEIIKRITGYAQWEEFRDNFREAQQKYAGTGKCMIEVKGFGCLVTW
ncbi:MAG: hypothetical protein V1807_01335 [Patescibacteria group bacterium]